MLILSRRINECVMIADDVKVMILGINGSQVKIGIEAPKSVPVHRLEIYHKIHSDPAANDARHGLREPYEDHKPQQSSKSHIVEITE